MVNTFDLRSKFTSFATDPSIMRRYSGGTYTQFANPLVGVELVRRKIETLELAKDSQRFALIATNPVVEVQETDIITVGTKTYCVVEAPEQRLSYNPKLILLTDTARPSNPGILSEYRLNIKGRITGITGTAGDTAITVTCEQHGLKAGQAIQISESDNYNGVYTVAATTRNTFTVSAPYVQDEFAGWFTYMLPIPIPVKENSSLEVGQFDLQVAAGSYTAWIWRHLVSPTGIRNSDLRFELVSLVDEFAVGIAPDEFMLNQQSRLFYQFGFRVKKEEQRIFPFDDDEDQLLALQVL